MHSLSVFLLVEFIYICWWPQNWVLFIVICFYVCFQTLAGVGRKFSGDHGRAMCLLSLKRRDTRCLKWKKKSLSLFKEKIFVYTATNLKCLVVKEETFKIQKSND